VFFVVKKEFLEVALYFVSYQSTMKKIEKERKKIQSNLCTLRAFVRKLKRIKETKQRNKRNVTFQSFRLFRCFAVQDKNGRERLHKFFH
jgi:hypothetical protein